jgi:hypothetical protein
LSLFTEFRRLLHIFKKYLPENHDYVRKVVFDRLENARLNLYYLRLRAGEISLFDFLKYKKIKPISKVKGLFYFVLNRMSKMIKILNAIGNKKVYI